MEVRRVVDQHQVVAVPDFLEERLVSDVDGRHTMLKTGAILCGNEAIHAALQKRIAAA